jgi:hypothetical protein
LSEKDIFVGALDGAESYIVEEEDGSQNAYYYIRRLIEDNMFELGIYIPDEFETDITHFEFWCDGIQIGSRTERSKSIRHLVLSKSEIDKAVVRFYDDDKYVAECEIDPQSYQGPLEIPGGYIVTKVQDKTQVGAFTVSRNTETSLASVKMEFLASENICYYTIKNGDGKFVLSANPIEATRTFEYLSLLVGDLGGLTIQCYDNEKRIKYEAYFDMEKYKLFLVE